MENICTGCLSTKRKIFKLESLGISWFGFEFNKDANICWECKRLLQRFEAFREQVVTAQRVLRSRKKKEPAQSLSNLTVSHKNSYDKLYLYEDLLKIETSVKDETLDHSDFESNDDLFCSPGNTSLREENGLTDSYVVHQQKDVLKRETVDVKDETFELNQSNVVATCLESVKEDVKELPAQNYVIKSVSREEMLLDRQQRLSSKRFLKALYKCESCITEFTMLKTYRKHKRAKHNKTFIYQCYVCAQTFKSETEASEHSREHYLFYHCTRCDVRKRTLGLFEAHYESCHETQRVYPCHICDEEFLTRRKKKAHVQSVHCESTTCEICNRTFCNATSLKGHIRTQHSQLPKVECPVCKRQYKSEFTLNQHVKTHEARAQPEAYCAECDVTFKTRVALGSHLRYSLRHASEDSFKHQCNECNKKFAMKYKLEDHIEREHLKILKYACEHCGKKFLSGLQKRSHLNKSHNVNAAVVDKRVHCNICGKQFSSASTCKKHQRVHTGERPYHCQLCPMRFSQASVLKTHVRGKHKDVAGLF